MRVSHVPDRAAAKVLCCARLVPKLAAPSAHFESAPSLLRCEATSTALLQHLLVLTQHNQDVTSRLTSTMVSVANIMRASLRLHPICFS